MFCDRRDAGRQLADKLRELAATRPVVLGLPRGGVSVAAEVARALEAQLDVLVVRKLGCPGQPELGVGAIGEDGIRVLNEDLITRAGMTATDLERVATRELIELERRVQRYRGGRRRVPVAGRTVIVIDDGLATGSTARAALEVVRRRGARRVVLAVPVAPAHTVKELASVADEVVCLHRPETFWAIGQFYDDFAQVSDEEVVDSLTQTPSGSATCPGRPQADDPPVEPEVMR